MSQNQAILDYLKVGNTLTGMDALKLFGTMKLASRISEIKDEIINEPFEIKSETIETTTGKHVSKYWIEQKKPRQAFEEKTGQYAFIK